MVDRSRGFGSISPPSQWPGHAPIPGRTFTRQSNTSADDLDVGKIGLIVVVLALFTTALATA